MERSAIFHRPKMNWAAAVDAETVEIRIRTKADDVAAVRLLYGDKYAWEETKRLVPMEKAWSDGLADYWVARVRPPYRRLQYAFRIGDGEEAVWMDAFGFAEREPVPDAKLFEFPYINRADVYDPPAWVADAVFYQIFPERFANGDPSNDPPSVRPWGGKPAADSFFGGDLQGVIDHLDHLEALGVDAIYFTPLFESPSNHKYNTRDYMKVDPHFGTNEKLKELIDACHARGIRVMLDAVFNHAGSTFPPFLDVLEKGRESRYADWFHIREFPPAVKDGRPTYETFAFVPEMPKWNTEHPEAKAYLFNVVRHWTSMGIDGWRLDVANEVDHRFWREFRQLVKSINPDAYILGEIWHDPLMWLMGDQFDAVMNYPFTTAVLDFVVHRKLDAQGFARQLSRLLASLPSRVHHHAFNLLDSHDTPRLLTLCGGNRAKMKLATAVQFAFPGAPCIYYGDEIGLEGGHDPDCRRCMEWDPAKQDRGLFDHYRALIRLRKRHPALRTGEFRIRSADPGGTVVAFDRFNERERLMVVLNNGETPQPFVTDWGGQRWFDAFTGELAVNGRADGAADGAADSAVDGATGGPANDAAGDATGTSGPEAGHPGRITLPPYGFLVLVAEN